MIIELPKDEFNILRQDEIEIHLYDKVVDKIYVYDIAKRSWKFPSGSRTDIIARLSGFDPWNSEVK